MKIGIDVRLWNETGVGRYIRNLIRYLQKIDMTNEYILFCLKADEENIKSGISNSNFQTKIANIRWHSIGEQILMPIILIRQRLDLVHFPYFSIPIFYPGQYVITIHDLIIYHYSTGQASTLPLPLYKIKRLGYSAVLRRSARKADKIIVPSKAVKADLIKSLNLDPNIIIVTPEGVDISLIRSNRNYKVNDSKNKKYFLYVGNAYPHKNLEVLIAAFLRLTDKRYSDTDLLLVGKTDYFYKKLSVKTKRHNYSNIKLLHDIDDRKLQELYQNALAVVSPSVDEGFGLVPLEAMANGCLVIASDNAAHVEVCDDAALYFKANDPEQLSSMMIDLINNSDNPKYQDQRKRGIERVKLFDWKKMAIQTKEIYEQFKK